MFLPPMTMRSLVLLGWLALVPGEISAQSAPADSAPSDAAHAWRAWALGTQINVIAQHLNPLKSPYTGPNSLSGNGDSQASFAFGLYTGARLWRGLEGYLDVEMIQGHGVSNVTGLGGITNGDVLRQGSTDLGNGPYVARAFLRYTVAFEHESADTAVAAPDQIPVRVARRRLEISAGKLALNDVFDVNRYATSTRLQFMNWGLWQNTAWDFAADTRGYSNGLAVAWITPRWAVRAASFQMPTAANGNKFDSHLLEAHGDQIELSISPGSSGFVARALVFENHARMGDYAEALRIGVARQRSPDIVADDASGRTKYGYGFNVEQPLADSGETGAFARFGWNDGRTESFVFTEVDQHVSAGMQIAGGHWGRMADRVGIAAVQHDLSGIHRAYLAAGGAGFLLGDGRLTYGSERIVESYYRWQATRGLQLSGDVQWIVNPGYNRDRGPATVVSFRANFRY
jgi:high affinity Mn2+ porin